MGPTVECTEQSGEKDSHVEALMLSIAELSTSQEYMAKEATDLLNKYVSREKLFYSAVNGIQIYCTETLQNVKNYAYQIRSAAINEATTIVANAKLETEAWEAKKAKLSVIKEFEGKIKLYVGGHRFTTSLTTLRRFPDTMLGAMFSGRHTFHLDEEGFYFIDRDGTHFRYILNFLRAPETFECDLTGTALKELKRECDYYALNELMFPSKIIPPFTCNTSSGHQVIIAQDEPGLWYANGELLRVCVHCYCAEYTEPTNSQQPEHNSTSFGFTGGFIVPAPQPNFSLAATPAPWAVKLNERRSFIMNFERAVGVHGGNIDFSIQPKPADSNMSDTESDSKITRGKLASSVACLLDDQMDVAKEAASLQEQLTSIISSFTQKENAYVSAVTKLHQDYDLIIQEAVDEATNLRNMAAAEGMQILVNAKQESAAWIVEKAALAHTQAFESRVKLDVGGNKFTTSLTTLRRFPDTMIGAIFSGRHALPQDEDGYHFIDRDGTHFRYILNFLRAPESFLPDLPPTQLMELREECYYYGLLELMFPFAPTVEFSMTTRSGEVINISRRKDLLWWYIPVWDTSSYYDLYICKYCHAVCLPATATAKAENRFIANICKVVPAHEILEEQPQPDTCVVCGHVAV
eukprot:gene15825-18077_t